MELDFGGTVKVQVVFGGDGSAKHICAYTCGDGWIVQYTTSRVVGGPHDGKFAVLVYKPVGTGSRTGKAKNWERTYFKGYAKRTTAKKHALALVDQHQAGKWKTTCPGCGEVTYSNRRSNWSCRECSGGVYTPEFAAKWVAS
jgi:ribosomal protein S27E